MTLSMATVPASSGLSPARSSAALITAAPRLGAGTSLRLPPNVPIAVRTGLAKTADRDDVMLVLLEVCGPDSYLIPLSREFPRHSPFQKGNEAVAMTGALVPKAARSARTRLHRESPRPARAISPPPK